MKLDARVAGLLLIAAGVMTAGAYVAFDASQRDRAVPSPAAPKTTSAQPSLPASHPRLPPSHPPLADARPPRGAIVREGKMAAAPARAVSHFRIGNHIARTIYADGGVMWVGTSGGMVRYDTASREFKIFDASNGLRSSGVLRVDKIRGRIAVGTFGGGLALLDPLSRAWEHFNVPEGLGDAFVYDLLEDSSGDVWIATGAGVNRVRAGALREQASWQLYTVENTGGGLPGDKVYAVAEGKDRSIWFATEGGIARFRGGRWISGPAAIEDASPAATRSATGTHAVAAAPGEAGRLTSLAVDKGGKVWAGTAGAGLRRFDGAGWRKYSVRDGLPSDRIVALHADGDGRLWIGTDKGLAVLGDEKFRVMTTADGLLADNVYSVRTTADGSVWVGSFGGVAHIRAPDPNRGTSGPRKQLPSD